MSGWVSIHRKMANNPIWTSEPFTRGQAWVDLILLANYREGYIRARGIKIPVKRGQVGTSQVTLTSRWQWSRGKVKRFLDELETDQQIVQQKNNVSSLITIVNYDEYQQDDTANSTADGQQTVQQTDSKQYTNNNNNNNKKENNKQPAKPVDDKYLKFCEHYYKKLIEASEAGYIGTIKSNTKWNGKAWTDSIRLLETSDGIPWSKITELASWYFTTNIKGNYRYQALSMASFREKFSAMETTMLKGDNSQPEQELSLAERMEQRK